MPVSELAFGKQNGSDKRGVSLSLAGPDRLGLNSSRTVFSDLVFFVGGGMAWEPESTVIMDWEPRSNARVPVFSSGLSVRLNLFRAFVLEPHLAVPFQRPLEPVQFGMLLLAGGW